MTTTWSTTQVAILAVALFLLVSMSHVLVVHSFLSNSVSRAVVRSRRHVATTAPSVVRLFGGGAPHRHSARSRQRNRKGDKEAAEDDDSPATATTLEWESFDFSDSPKWDRRFDDDSMDSLHLASSVEEWQQIEERETKEDQALQERFEREHRAWKDLDEILVKEATDVLLPWIQPERWERIQSRYQQRTQHTRFLFENPANPSNVWACLRTLDSFGIQHVDVVIQSGQFQGKAALVQKRGMRTAMGSAKWLTVKNHLSTRHALNQIRSEGYRILCTDVNPTSKDIREMNWDITSSSSSSTMDSSLLVEDDNETDNDNDEEEPKLCIVMGNEQRGISDEVKEFADGSFYLPMAGFAESFNLSVATAITCAHLSAASRDGRGPLRPGDLPPDEYNTLLLRGALNSIDQRTAKALLKAKGVILPKDLPL